MIPIRPRAGGLAPVLGLVLTALFAALPARAETLWNAYTYNSVATLTAVQGLQRMADAIERESGGTLKLRIHLGGSLQIQAVNITSAVSDDVVQFADDSLILGSIPIAGVLRLPMLVRDRAEYMKAKAIVNPLIEAAYAKKDVIVLGDYIYPTQVIWSRKKLESLADLSGQKIRTTSPEQGEFVKRFGGIPVPLGTPEVPAALDRGVIDGALTATSGAGYVWRDLLKYNYRLGLNFNNSFVIVNKDEFSKLSPELQGKVRGIVQKEAAAIDDGLMAEEQDLTAKMEAAGLKVTAERPDDVAAAVAKMTAYWDEWAKTRGPQASKALADVRAALGR